MRSEMVFAAKRRLPNRYMLCRVLSTATRRIHRPNTRIEDTTDAVLRHLACASEPPVTPDTSDVFDVEERIA